MSESLANEPDDEIDDGESAADEVTPIPGGKNYITPGGIERLKEERQFLLTKERPAVVQVVAWAASNGDRSENADYQYSKRRLRQIDGRVRFLTKRIETAEVIDPEAPRTGQRATRVFFGATVRYENAAGSERVVSIVGTDEVDLDQVADRRSDEGKLREAALCQNSLKHEVAVSGRSCREQRPDVSYALLVSL